MWVYACRFLKRNNSSRDSSHSSRDVSISLPCHDEATAIRPRYNVFDVGGGGGAKEALSDKVGKKYIRVEGSEERLLAEEGG